MGVATATFVESFKARDWRHFDVQLLLYVILLIGFGVVMGYSAGYNDTSAGAGMSQTVKTLIWATIGLILFFVVASVDYHWLRSLALPIYLLVLGLLAITMLIGTNLFGAQMSVTIAGLDFQFSEVGKVLMIVVLAAYLAGRRERIGRLATILVAAALMAVPAFLVFRQPDLGTALVFVGILVGMLFMSGASLGWMGLIAAAVDRRCAGRRQHAARIPATTPVLLPRPVGRSAGRVLPAHPGAERGRVGGLARPRPDGRGRGPAGVHSRSVHRFHLHRRGRGSRLRRRGGGAGPVRPAAVAHPVDRLAARATRSG